MGATRPAAYVSRAALARRPRQCSSSARTAHNMTHRCMRAYRSRCSSDGQGGATRTPARRNSPVVAGRDHGHASPSTKRNHAMSQPSTIRLERTTPQTARITFANPPANLVIPESIVALHKIVDELENDPDIQVVVFSSELPG